MTLGMGVGVSVMKATAVYENSFPGLERNVFAVYIIGHLTVQN